MRPELRAAIESFNRADYFSSQEQFERAWHESSEEERPFVEALVQLSVALYLHFHRGGGRGRNHLLQACLLRLEDYRPSYLEIDVDALYDDVSSYLEELRRNKVASRRWFEKRRAPKIRLLSKAPR
ncbi:MAG: hypothetical protein KatS3mg076_2290 [Candidatus Binatia bacterium]|nr:MAG: hypothetical protein KatS3mg076_2290 [Candidatus Binatia bacterium]